MRGYVCEARFDDIGTVADYWRTCERLMGAGGSRVGRAARIDPSACVTESILWDDVTIGRHATIDTCIVTDRVSIPDRASYQRMILRRDPHTGAVRTSPLTID